LASGGFRTLDTIKITKTTTKTIDYFFGIDV